MNPTGLSVPWGVSLDIIDLNPVENIARDSPNGP